MPKIRLIVEHDDGNQTAQSYELNGDMEQLDGIDDAVEQFQHAALPRLEQQLLSQAQTRAVAQEKKTQKTAAGSVGAQWP